MKPSNRLKGVATLVLVLFTGLSIGQIALCSSVGILPNLKTHPYIEYQYGISPRIGLQIDYGKHHSSIISTNYCWWATPQNMITSNVSWRSGIQQGYRFKIGDEKFRVALGAYLTNNILQFNETKFDLKFANKFKWRSLAFDFDFQYTFWRNFSMGLGYFQFISTYELPDYAAGFLQFSVIYQVQLKKH